ncbi:hypothetical protein LC603019_01436 [Lawsonella clevelandensis]|uniref:Uncharacterized protein n=1 Tax=Lawsonella clevelandensis TaxID=1528099 RepID=A0A5E3ZYT1_9ACTN|nr:hypothetical protein LC603019_01436 [Lawsonella clevelandensis]
MVLINYPKEENRKGKREAKRQLCAGVCNG